MFQALGRARLAYKSAAIVVAIVAGPLVIAAVASMTGTNKIIPREPQGPADALGQGLAAGIWLPLSVRERKDVQKAIGQVLSNGEVLFVGVYRGDEGQL